jgi:hypothetical protein
MQVIVDWNFGGSVISFIPFHPCISMEHSALARGSSLTVPDAMLRFGGSYRTLSTMQAGTRIFFEHVLCCKFIVSVSSLEAESILFARNCWTLCLA